MYGKTKTKTKTQMGDTESLDMCTAFYADSSTNIKTDKKGNRNLIEFRI